MAQWWRAYNEALDDPKLQKLPAELFRAWFNLVCLAARNNGVLPALDDIAFALRTTPQKADKILVSLIDAKLFDTTDDGVKPHNWSSRQYESDVSTDRVKRFRQRSKNAKGNAPESDTDQKQIQSANFSLKVFKEKALPSKLIEEAKVFAQGYDMERIEKQFCEYNEGKVVANIRSAWLGFVVKHVEGNSLQ